MTPLRGLSRITALAIVALLVLLLVGCPPKTTGAPTGAEQASATPKNAPVVPSESEKAPASSDESEKGATSEAGVKWVTSLEEGLKTAAAEKKPLMVDFYADWCGWCKKLDKETYTDAKVIEKSKEFVCVKVDTEQDKASAKKYEIEGLPTILFLDASGAKIHDVVGYAGPADFLAEMEKALEKAKGA